MDDNDASEAIDLALTKLEGQRASHVDMMGTTPFAPLAQVQRPGVVAVVLQNNAMRITVVVDYHEGGWRVPTMLTGSRRNTAARALETGPMGLQAKSMKKVRWPSTDPKRSTPEHYWFTLTGLAAVDVDHVVVTSDVDTFRAVPDSDGVVLALVEATDTSNPAIVVHTRDGREVLAGP